jgi:hypothetical protein
MKRVAQLRMMALAMALSLASGGFAAAQQEPLVIIRFNQPRVYYEKQLYGAVSQAVAVKPEVMFDLVSFVPTRPDPKLNAGWEATSRQNAQAVMNSLKRMGVPTSRVSYRTEPVQNAQYDIIYLFVR